MTTMTAAHHSARCIIVAAIPRRGVASGLLRSPGGFRLASGWRAPRDGDGNFRRNLFPFAAAGTTPKEQSSSAAGAHGDPEEVSACHLRPRPPCPLWIRLSARVTTFRPPRSSSVLSCSRDKLYFLPNLLSNPR